MHDSSDDQGRLDRRTFLAKGMAAAAGFGCLTFGQLRKAVAQSRVTAKPILTQASLNALIPKQPAQFRAAAQQARTNFKAYIRSHFTLTPAQDTALTAMTQSDVNQVLSAINTALEKNYRLQVRMSPRSPGSGNPTIQKPVLKGATGPRGDPITSTKRAYAEKEPGVQVGAVTITADGSYSHHDGFTGTVSFSWSC